MSLFKPNRGPREIKKIKCPACGKIFEATEGQSLIPGFLCRDCNHLSEELEEYKTRLPKEKNPGKIKKIQEEIKKLEKKLKI